jgi:hypothetical protein
MSQKKNVGWVKRSGPTEQHCATIVNVADELGAVVMRRKALRFSDLLCYGIAFTASGAPNFRFDFSVGIHNAIIAISNASAASNM